MAIVKPLIHGASISATRYVTLPGTLEGVTENGVALVDFPGNDNGSVQAQCALNDDDRAKLTDFPVKVVLLIDESCSQPPIITGLVRDTLRAECSGDEFAVTNAAAHERTEVSVDGRRLTFDAREELLLRCGKSSILLRRDGKIVIKGANLVSRSSGANKIKGGSVNIN